MDPLSVAVGFVVGLALGLAICCFKRHNTTTPGTHG